MQTDIRYLRDTRQMCPPSKIPGAYERNLQIRLRTPSVEIHPACSFARASSVHRYRFRIAQQHPQTTRRRIHHSSVSLGSIFQIELVRDQRLKIDSPVCHQPQKLLHVSLLGPAYVSDRIVVSTNLVIGIVTTWSISARHEKFDFLHVHLGPGKLHLNRTHDHDRSAVAADVERQFARG